MLRKIVQKVVAKVYLLKQYTLDTTFLLSLQMEILLFFFSTTLVIIY